MDENTKSILTSKTFWVNLLTVVVILINRKERIVDPLIVEPLAVVILPFVNMVLRSITNKPVKWTLK